MKKPPAPDPFAPRGAVEWAIYAGLYTMAMCLLAFLFFGALLWTVIYAIQGLFHRGKARPPP